MTYSEHSKRLVRIFLPFLLIALLLFLTACGTPLPAPSGVNIDEITLTLSWNPVNGADYYTVRIDGNGGSQEVDSGKNSYSLERLSEGSYTLRVKAVVGSGSDTYTDSAWSQSISFTRDHETGLTFRQIESNTAFEVSGLGAAQGDIVVPDVYRGLPVIRIGDKAFYNKNTVTSVSLGGNIREIGAQAFTNCSALKSITLSEGLLTIGDQAFQSCRALESALTLPDSVTSIGAQAFEYCRALPSVTFGGKLTSIGTKAFNGCSALTSVLVPDNVKSLGDGAFSACSALSSVTLGSGITAIGTDTFRRCTSLTAFTAGANVQSIGDYAFAESTALAAVTIGDNVRSIGTQAFYGCTALTDVTLGSGVEQIAKQAFHQTGLWQESGATYVDGWFLGTKDTASPVTLEDGTTGIADYAFDGYDNFDATLVIPDSVRYIGAGAFKDSKSLANVVIGGGVESIGDEAFSGCTGLTNAILGKLQDGALTQSSLTSIGDYAFRGCTALMDITMPDTLERVGMYAFRDSGLWTNATREVYAGNWLVECKDNDSYGSLSFPEGTAGIADYALYGCDFITSAAIPESVRHIGRSAFYQCTNLTQVVLPSTLTAIEDYTFYHCDNLASLSTRIYNETEQRYDTVAGLPQTLNTIGRSAFYKCALGNSSTDTDYDELVIPDSVTSIGDYAFYGCGFTVSTENGDVQKGVDSVVIGKGVTAVGNYAFANMGSLKSVILGDNVLSVGERAFYKCAALTDVVFGNRIESIGERAFYGCSALTAAHLPGSVRTIGDYAFYKCTSLSEVSLGNAESIGDYAFFGCTALANIRLPKTLTSIGKQAFRNCSSLQGIYLPASVSEIGTHAFYGCNALTVYTDRAAAGEGWNARWNSSYRPVVWGCTFSDGALVSFVLTQTSISNTNLSTRLTAPVREGYTFAGWSTQAGGAAEYSLNGLSSVPFGTTLYAVWTADNANA